MKTVQSSWSKVFAKILNSLLSPKQIVFITCSVSFLSLGFGFIAEYGFDIKPCELCWYQRYVYIASFLLSGMIFVLLTVKKTVSNRIVVASLIMVAITFLTNSAIAIYQVLVEQKWVTLPALCKGIDIDMASVTFEEFQRQMQAAGDHVPCDQVPWELLGISMAGYNALLTFGMFIFVLWGIYKTIRHKN